MRYAESYEVGERLQPQVSEGVLAESRRNSGFTFKQTPVTSNQLANLLIQTESHPTGMPAT